MVSKQKYLSCLPVLSLSLSLGLMLMPRIATARQTDGFGAVSAQPQTADSIGKLKFETESDRAPETSIAGASRFTDPLNFQPPADEGSPEQSTGGATRSGGESNVCPQDRNRGFSGPSLTAVSPASNQGLTVSGHPTFLVYVPPTSAGQALFVLQDDLDPDGVREIYETTFDLPESLTETGGLVSIKIPENLPELEIGKTYTYYATLVCSPGDNGINYEQGFVTRVEVPANIAQVQQNEALSLEQSLWQQTVLYAESGIWLDTVNSLVALMEYEPGNKVLENQWTSLLRSDFVDLDEAIAKAKIVHLSEPQ